MENDDIQALYKRSTQAPSAELDAEILAMAAARSRPASPWLRRAPVLATAAVLVVSVSVVLNQSDPVLSTVDAPPEPAPTPQAVQADVQFAPSAALQQDRVIEEVIVTAVSRERADLSGEKAEEQADEPVAIQGQHAARRQVKEQEAVAGAAAAEDTAKPAMAKKSGPSVQRNLLVTNQAIGNNAEFAALASTQRSIEHPDCDERYPLPDDAKNVDAVVESVSFEIGDQRYEVRCEKGDWVFNPPLPD